MPAAESTAGRQTVIFLQLTSFGQAFGLQPAGRACARKYRAGAPAARGCRKNGSRPSGYKDRLLPQQAVCRHRAERGCRLHRRVPASGSASQALCRKRLLPPHGAPRQKPSPATLGYWPSSGPLSKRSEPPATHPPSPPPAGGSHLESAAPEVPHHRALPKAVR